MSQSSVKNNATRTVTVSSYGGFNSQVSLSVTGLPAGSSAVFSPTTIPGSGTSTLTLSRGTAVDGTYTLTLTGTAGAQTFSTPLYWLLDPCSSGVYCDCTGTCMPARFCNC